MKKFLTKEESQYLINEIGINSDYASYIEKHDSRFDTSTLTTLEYFSISKKDDIQVKFYDPKKGKLCVFNKSYNDEDSIFSIGDTINIIERIYRKTVNEVLDEMKWNYLSYESEDNNELIDYLYKYIIENENS